MNSSTSEKTFERVDTFEQKYLKNKKGTEFTKHIRKKIIFFFQEVTMVLDCGDKWSSSVLKA